MSNRRLTESELTTLFGPLLADVRSRLRVLAADDDALHWALRRKLAKELTYDERSKPAVRKGIKARKIAEQGGRCAICSRELPPVGSVQDRLEAMKGYTMANTRVLCPTCDTEIQASRRYS